MSDISMKTADWKVQDVPKTHNMSLSWSVAFIASTLLVVFGHLLIKAGLISLATHASAVSLSERLGAYFLQSSFVEGLVLYALGSVCWIVAVAQKDVSFLYPLTSINYVLVVAGSMVVFHEAVSTRRWMGVALIAIGVLLLNRTEVQA